eukprot:486309-Amorphochlora_amoeboformis.AAC.2
MSPCMTGTSAGQSRSHVDMAAARLKDEGNKLFREKNWDGASTKYTEAIEKIPGTPADAKMKELKASLLSNRAACRLRECGVRGSGGGKIGSEKRPTREYPGGNLRLLCGLGNRQKVQEGIVASSQSVSCTIQSH